LRKTAIALVALASAVLLVAVLVHLTTPSQASPNEGWPAAVARPLALSFPADFPTKRVYLDAGHGAEDNRGNQSCFCRDEQDFTLSLAIDVAQRLEQTRRFIVRVSRKQGELKDYASRVVEAEQFGADVFVSLHSDVRGDAEPWAPEGCLRSRAAPGFAILWSDEGEPSLADRRVAFARTLAAALERSAIQAYDGREYHEHYAPDLRAGVFVDRHAHDERIFVLWRPSMPSILVETHNALDDREALRWEEAATREAFANALAAALIESKP
jgi:N-acetylmuramoyl-L-alanine amidase